MDTWGFRRIPYLILMFYWLDVNATVVHCLPFQNVTTSPGNDSMWKTSSFAVAGREQEALSLLSPKNSDEIHSQGRATAHLRSRRFKQLTFSKPVYSFEINEDTPPGTALGFVEARNIGQDRQATYSLVEDDGDGLFVLNPNTGEFTLSHVLDYEIEQYYILTVGAGLGQEQFARVRVYFNVLDINDNSPVFSLDAYTVAVLENIPTGSCFFSLNATDADDGLNAELNWSVISGDEEGRFAVGSNGVICLQKELDRETESIYSLTIQVCDCALPEDSRLTSTTHVTIYVEDVNDNAPFFNSGKSVHVLEDTPLHAVVMTVHAVDLDTGPNSDIEYSLENLSGKAFRIDSSSGRVFLEEKLDRESTGLMTVLLTARDKGSPPLSTSMNLSVLIDDANDNSPAFTQSAYNVTVMEDAVRGLDVLRVFAYDSDEGANGQVRYSISQSPFLIDSVTGTLSVMDKLDREKSPTHTVTVTAVDRGEIPRSATAVVHVVLSDVNDFIPTFSPPLMTVHLLENMDHLPQVILQVSARDEDLGVNSQLTYSIDRGNEDGHFSLSPNGTLGVLHSLDRELRANYKLDVIAVDSGFPPLTGSGTIQILLDDVNDNKPLFIKNFISVSLYEDVPVGTTCAIIDAFDLDEGVNGEIRYSLEGGSSFFSIDQSSGVIFTTAELDRETVASYSLTVIGMDKNATHPLSSSVTVSVDVRDVNDQSPQFLNGPYVANVPNTVTTGSIICTVRAVDGDIGLNAKLKFSLFGPNSDQFSTDAARGVIFVSGSVSGPEDITISVRVVDSGNNSKMDTTTVTIRFQDATEFPRVTAASFEHLLPEDQPLNSQVTVVTAESNRKQLLGPILYYLAAGNFEEVFEVHEQSGAVTLKKPLDYETNKELLLWVEARDSGSPPFSSYVKIHINVSDVNDNSPVFTQSVYMCEVTENMPPSQVCEVLAIDLDSGIDGDVQYSILSGDTDNTFTIDINSGIIKTRKSTDREKVPLYNLTIQARDKGNELHTGTAMVIVAVLDANDNAPRFSQIFFTDIPENAPVGFIVIQITSTDEDIGEHAMSTYTIVNNSDRLPFAIDEASGHITVIQSLDRETKDRYIVKVNANDSAWNVNTEVTIYVTDINDNSPVFSQLSYSITIPETRAREIFLIQVYARDADLGQNGQIVYYIEPPSDIFRINATTGDILSKQPIALHDLEMQSHRITVVASDCGDVPHRNNTIVTVNFVQYNYFSPVFLPFPSVTSVPFNLDVGTKVLQLSAVDKDFHSNGIVEYFVSGGNASLYFEVDRSGGMVFLNSSLKQNMNKLLTLQITAKDKGVPPLSTLASVRFLITDENRFAPQFSASQVTFFVPEDLPVGSVIGRVKAQDKDQGANGFLYYALEMESEGLIFSIGHSTGLITLLSSLDFEKQDVHRLQVTAKDDGWISKTSKLDVVIEVQDINDNPPVFSAKQYIVSVPENSPIGTSVFQVEATDIDSGENSQISYSLIKGHIDMFALDPHTGVITTQEMFDFELQQVYKVIIKASNPGNQDQMSLAQVCIQITGVNEYIPRFSKSQYDFAISERSPVGTKLGQISATDYDLGLDGDIYYLLVGQSKKVGFDIDKNSGEIYVVGDLRQYAQNHAVLRILAKNKGSINGSNVDEALVLVNVLDTNDPPEFFSDVYHAHVSEGTEVGTSVIKVAAVDQDSFSEWNHFFYSIESGNENNSFSLHPLNGVISVAAPLDREQWPFYNLTVVAIDEAPLPATGRTKVLITVSDINDNAPVLSSAVGHVRENQLYGTIITILNATDADLPPNQGPFTYQLGKFELENSFMLSPDGVLSTIKPVDRERNNAFPLPVVIQDAGIPPLSTTATVHITVLDENDNPSKPRNIYIEVKYYSTSFPGGLIGNVRPEDPDISDVFNCSLKNGPKNVFGFPAGKCDLWSSPYQGEAKFNLIVEAHDNHHPSVNNSVYVNFKGFSNASINNCILLYVTSPSFEVFLSVNYLKLIKALENLFNLQASKIHVFGMKPLQNKTLLLAAVKSYNGQYISGEVVNAILSAQKTFLEDQSDIKILAITSDPCFMNPCQNEAACNKNVYVSPGIEVLESPTTIFVTPKNVEVFNCSCLPGFTGALCELDINECSERQCEHGGTCLNYPGGFSCHCMAGYSGPLCSVDIDECKSIFCQNGGTCFNFQGDFHCECSLGYAGKFCEQSVNHCASFPCLQGTCSNSHTGYICHCPFGVSGINCEEHSYGLEELSYMEFPPLDPRNNVFSLELATVQENSLLVYNYASMTGSASEFLALEIVDGKLQLSYNLGNGTVRLKTEKIVADGHFHKVLASRMGKVASLEVDSCSDDESDRFCYARSGGIGTERTLDVGSNNMMFGGIKSIDPILHRQSQVRTDDFIGCVKNVRLNGIPLDLSRALASYNVLERCPRQGAPCGSNVCLNGGVCIDHWSFYLCHCSDGFTGENCGTRISEDSALQLNGEVYVDYIIKESHRRRQQMRELVNGRREWLEEADNLAAIEVKLKTPAREGMLLHCQGREGHTTLKMTDGRLHLVSEDSLSGYMEHIFSEAFLSDGFWHILHLQRNGPFTSLVIDNHHLINTTNHTHDFTGINVERIFLGKVPKGYMRNQPEAGFMGCIEYLRYNGQILPFSGFNEVVEVQPRPPLVHTGCVSFSGCASSLCSEEIALASCLSYHCINGGTCNTLAEGNVSCVCLLNFTGALCELCSSDIDNRAVCYKTKESVPLWIIAIIIPATVALIIFILFLLFRLQAVSLAKQEPKTSEKGKQGTDNKAFHDDNADTPIQDIDGKDKEPDIIKAEKQISSTEKHIVQRNINEIHPGLYCGSETEYCEIESTSSIMMSDTNAIHPRRYNSNSKHKVLGQNVKLSLQEQRQNSAVWHNTEDSAQRDEEQSFFKMPQVFVLENGRKFDQRISEVGNLRQVGTGPVGQVDYQYEKDREARRKYLPETTGAPLGLTIDEVKKLNEPHGQTQDPLPGPMKRPCHSMHLSPKWASTHPSRADSSSDSDTHSSFTCSEYELERELSLTNGQWCLCKQAAHSALADCAQKRDRSRKTSSPLREGCDAERSVDSSSPGAARQWESLLSLGLRFESYAEVFEDIAGLPITQENVHPLCFDRMSELEEIF
ncbi:protocadherin Fat 4 [Lepisosteus oculatus]|uniref:protocadherin Fat 4 n=1 Tax=Lepisosteus oculatus TaxID=7918 RepID=UPI0037208B59